MTTLSASKTRIPPGTFNLVAYKGERVAVKHRNGASLYLVSEDDLKLLELAEDLLDLKEAQEALEEMKTKGEAPIPWEEAKKRLGL